MFGLSTSIDLATVIHFLPVHSVPTPPFIRLVVVLLWTFGIVLVSVGSAAFVAIAVSSQVRRRWYALAPLGATGLLTLVMGTTILVRLA
jgi:hypothetical protein